MSGLAVYTGASHERFSAIMPGKTPSSRALWRFKIPAAVIEARIGIAVQWYPGSVRWLPSRKYAILDCAVPWEPDERMAAPALSR